MTLIIAVKCKDGAVLGADGAATITNALNQPTIQQPVRQKLQVIAGQVVVGVSGNVAFGQAFGREISDAWSDKAFAGKTPSQSGALLRQALWRRLQPEVAIAHEAAKAFGQQAIHNIVTATVVAMPLADQPCLFSF